MRIGIDFDNTLVDYRAVFPVAARQAGLVDPGFRGDRMALRAAIRARSDGETDWQRLQGCVYGAMMGWARLMPGAARFLRRCAEAGHTVCIVSHKTEFNRHDPARTNLRDAARAWMARRACFAKVGGGVFFEPTRAAKLARIAALAPDLFIDDLPELFDDPDFPPGPERVLFSPSGTGKGQGRIVCRSWAEVGAWVFGSEC